jgi:guanylate kinase
MGKVLIFVGGSCSGKSTTEEYFVDRGWAKRVIQCTTREPRVNEKDGDHYHFLTVPEFHNKGCFNIILITPEWLYGILPETLDEIKASDNTYIYSVINIEYAQIMMEHLKDQNIPGSIVYFNIDVNQRIELLRMRGETEEDIEIRLNREDLLKDQKSFFPDIEIKFLSPELPEWLYKKIKVF